MLLVTALLVYAADRAAKIWAESSLLGRPPIRLIPGVLHLRYTTNTGGAFGLGDESPLLFAVASILVSVLIVAAAFRIESRGTAVALGLVLGGALGNLTDRAVRGDGLGGPVVDFIDLQVWPVFNLADSAIVIGAVLLVLVGVVRERRAGRGEEEE